MGSGAHKSTKWGSRAWKIRTSSFSYIMDQYQTNYEKKKKILAKHFEFGVENKQNGRTY